MTLPTCSRTLLLGITAMVFAVASHIASAGPLRERMAERRAQQPQHDALEEAGPPGATLLPAGARVVRDQPYGRDRRQRFDVYLPAQATNAPVIFLVHGGGWARGDKAMKAVVENKVARWVPKGFIVVSTNYRLLPNADPLEQAADVAHALAAAQERAASWGGERSKFILVGHSAGAHLIALLAASPSLSAQSGATPWLGTVLLDSAALDVVQVMQAPHPGLYDRAFGNDPMYWRSASPFHALAKPAAPLLAVCSTRRADACPQAEGFVKKALSFGTRAAVLEQDLSHRDINQRLGEGGSYTEAVEDFLRTLDDTVHRLLAKH